LRGQFAPTVGGSERGGVRADAQECVSPLEVGGHVPAKLGLCRLLQVEDEVVECTLVQLSLDRREVDACLDELLPREVREDVLLQEAVHRDTRRPRASPATAV